jgi:hypothetical protein
MNRHYELLRGKGYDELKEKAIERSIFNAETLSKEELAKALYKPSRYNQRAVRRYLAKKFNLHHKAFNEGNYIKWKSTQNTVCVGRYLGVTGEGRIKVAWKWSDKWVKWGTVDPYKVLDFQNRIYHGFSS